MTTGASEGWRVRVAALSDPGPRREHNEDSVALLLSGEALPRLPGERWPTGRSEVLASAAGLGLLVLDGMGGQSTGDVPCALILQSLAAEFVEGLPAAPGPRGLWLAGALRRASAHARDHGTPHAGQGATGALAVVHGRAVHVVHVGDARVYRLRDGQLELLTRDDSLRNLAREHGVDEADLGDVPPGILTQALGFGEIEPHLQCFEAAEGDVLLVCSDGLHEFVSAAEMATTLQASDDPARVCVALVDLAVAGRSNDNITALVARIEREP